MIALSLVPGALKDGQKNGRKVIAAKTKGGERSGGKQRRYKTSFGCYPLAYESIRTQPPLRLIENYQFPSTFRADYA